MREFVVHHSVQETSNVTTLYCEPVDGNNVHYQPGQYMTIYCPQFDTPEGKAYSLSSAPDDPFLLITIKAIGNYSRHLCSLQPGDIIQASEPYGFFFEDTHAPLFCLASGVGISPHMSILRSVLKKDPNRHITLLYSNRTVHNIAYAQSLHEMTQHHPNTHIFHHITQQILPPGHPYTQGRITKKTLDRLWNVQAQYLLCGSESFVTAMYHLVRAAGAQDTQISTETFFS